MTEGIYSRDFIVQPDHCDMAATMSPLAAFIAFQAISAEHAQELGIGVSAMMKSGKFWVITHNRIEFTEEAHLLDVLKVSTWPFPCGPEDTRVYRGYTLNKADKLLAYGYTQWAITGADGGAVPFKESGFPEDYQFMDIKKPSNELEWFIDDFTQEDKISEVTVRSTGIDFGRHLNNIAYIRMMLDQFPAKYITARSIQAIEIHYGHPCKEGETLSVYRKQEGNTFRYAIRKTDGNNAALGSVKFRAQ